MGAGHDTTRGPGQELLGGDRVACVKDDIVGEGPAYESILQNARDLVAEWVPWGVENSQNSWGAPPFHLWREADGTHTISVATFGWEKRGLGYHAPIGLKELRASAISLLVYCAAYEVLDTEPAPQATPPSVAKTDTGGV